MAGLDDVAERKEWVEAINSVIAFEGTGALEGTGADVRGAAGAGVGSIESWCSSWPWASMPDPAGCSST